MTQDVLSNTGDRRYDVEQREALVLGHDPRVSPLAASELTEDLLKIIMRLIAVNSTIDAREKEQLTDLISDHDAGASSSTMATHLANLPEVILTMLRHPELFARQTEIGLQLLGKGALPARDRELAVLRIGWLCQAPYEWGEHVHIAKTVGVTSDEIERITHGSYAPGWTEHDQAVVRAAEELHDDAMISDATWLTLAKRFDERQLIELPVVIGQYQATAYYQNSLRLRLHPGNPGLKAR